MISADPVASGGWRLRSFCSHIPLPEGWLRLSKAMHVHTRLVPMGFSYWVGDAFGLRRKVHHKSCLLSLMGLEK